MNVKFDLAQIITVISIVLVVIGWFVNQWLNRKNEIKKEARTYRLKMLSSIIDFRLSFVKSKCFNDYVQILYDKAYTDVQLYGNNDEIKLFTKFRDTAFLLNYKKTQLEKSSSEKLGDEVEYNLCVKKLESELEQAINKLSICCRNNIRKELNLKKYNAK